MRRFKVHDVENSKTKIELCHVSTTMPNAFLGAIALAYNNHLPLCLSPNMLWLVICQVFAKHIELSLPPLAEKKLLQFVYEGTSSEMTWSRGLDDTYDALKNDPIASLILTEENKHVFTITAMGAVRNLYDFKYVVLCGFPEIELDGEIEEWKNVYKRTLNFKGFGLDWWVDLITPYILEFCKKNPDPSVFRKMFSYDFGCGGNSKSFTGWIRYFFPYTNTFYLDKLQIENRLIVSVPPSFCEVEVFLSSEIGPVTPNDTRVKLTAGFLHVAQRLDFTLTPVMGWDVVIPEIKTVHE